MLYLRQQQLSVLTQNALCTLDILHHSKIKHCLPNSQLKTTSLQKTTTWNGGSLSLATLDFSMTIFFLMRGKNEACILSSVHFSEMLPVWRKRKYAAHSSEVLSVIFSILSLLLLSHYVGWCIQSTKTYDSYEGVETDKKSHESN